MLVAGDRATATAGDDGTATAGRGGTATAGRGGTATAGYDGTATAGDCGVIVLTDPRTRRRQIGRIGVDDGLLPGIAYQLAADGTFIEAISGAGR